MFNEHQPYCYLPLDPGVSCQYNTIAIIFIADEELTTNLNFRQHDSHGYIDYRGGAAEQIKRFVYCIRWWWRCANPTWIREMVVLCNHRSGSPIRWFEHHQLVF